MWIEDLKKKKKTERIEGKKRKRGRTVENVHCSVRPEHTCHEFMTYSFSNKCMSLHAVQYVLRIRKWVNFSLLNEDLPERETF
jgi:hypothetical protein